MAGVGRNWAKALVIAVLFLGAGRSVFAQIAECTSVQGSATASKGMLAGKLTDLLSKPLGGVVLVARNQATGAETRTITSKNGAYRFCGLEPGEYTLEAESRQLGRGHVEGIVVEAGHEARVQAAMELEPVPSTPVLAALPIEKQPTVATPPVSAHPVPPLAVVAATPAHSDAEPSQLSEARPASASAGQTFDKLRAGSEAPAMQPAPAIPALSKTVANGAPATETKPASPIAPVAEPTVSQTVPSPPHAAGLATATAPAVTPPLASPAALPAIPSPDNPFPGPAHGPILAASQKSDPVSPAVSTTMGAAELQALPASGRRWQDFVLDSTPGSAVAAGGQGQSSLMGVVQPQGELAVDGAVKGLAFGTTGGSSESGQEILGQGVEPAGMAQVGASGHGFAISEAAIRAVQTAAGSVETAAIRASGGRMNVETQRGTSELHGQGFLFDRQNIWGARNPFTQWVQNTGTLTTPEFTSEPYTPPDHETTWGIGAGSRIRRDQLFWFGALDGYGRNDPGVSSVKNPDEFFAQPTNDYAQVLSARLDESEAKANSDYQGMLENLDQLLGPAPRTARQWTGFGRLDWEAAERHHFTLEGIGAHWNSPGGGLTRVSETYGNHSYGSTKASEEWMLGRWEAFLTPNLLAVTQGSAGREIQEARPETPSALEQGFLNGNTWDQLPQIVVDNRYGFTIGNPSRFGAGSYPDEHLYQGQESVDWIRGNLLVKAGFSISHNGDVTTLLRNQTGTYHYASMENFASDALVFGAFGPSDALDPNNQHNCDETGKLWRDSGGNLRGLGNLPCYSYYSQTMGPAGWFLSTNDWAGYISTQWQANKWAVVSAGLRWEREQLPPPIAALRNPELPLTEKLPSLGNNWAPRIGLAVGTGEKHWPVLRLGYGMFFGRTENATLETALTQTGSLNGDLSFFMRPTDDLPNSGGGAPPFPYVLSGEPGSVIKPGAVEFAPNFHNPEVHQAVAAVEETLPGGVEVTASAMVSLGRRLPISIDNNIDLTGSPQPIIYGVVNCPETFPNTVVTCTGTPPIHTPTSPPRIFYSARLNPDYQQIDQITSKANSTYEAGMLKVSRYGRRGLSLHAHYTYAHAMDWNPNESAQVVGSDVLDPNPANFNLEYGTSNLDVRHSAGAMVVYEPPWKLRDWAGKLGNGWMVSGIMQFRSGLPYTMRVSGSLPDEYSTTSGNLIEALGPGMNGSGGDNRLFGVGRNTYRYPFTWKMDMRLGRRFDLGKMRQLELLAESFNLFNHQNVTELESTGYYIERGSSSGELPTLNFLNTFTTQPPLTSLNPTTGFGQPLNINATNFYRERQIQFGLRLRY